MPFGSSNGGGIPFGSSNIGDDVIWSSYNGGDVVDIIETCPDSDTEILVGILDSF